jgi:hypothetical protein
MSLFYLYKSTEILKSKPLVKLHSPNPGEEELNNKGQAIGAPWEEELVRLETIIRPYHRVGDPVGDLLHVKLIESEPLATLYGASSRGVRRQSR